MLARWCFLDIILLLLHLWWQPLPTVVAADEPGQQFREVPESVLAAEGSSVTLLCAVDHQQGRAQWTKDGFALGFERGVPGYPRYRYTGDPSKGEHYLVIEGVTLQDDGEYQCQVGPTAVAAPIWASATVTVLVPPSGIIIVGWRDDAVVELVQGASLTLECRVIDARPAPSISWYRDGLPVDNAQQADEQETGSHRRLVTLRSRLLVTASAQDDGQQYSCRGGHPALRDAKAALVASVTLSVLHPPVSVSLSGWTKDDLGKAGHKVRLQCQATGGNPPPTITWYRRGSALATPSPTNDHAKTVDSASSGANVGHLSRVIKSEVELVLEAEDDGGVVTCKANSDLLEASLSDNVTLAVMYGARFVHISGPSSLTEEQSADFSCTSAPANPPVALRWTVNGEEVPTTEEVTVKKNPDGGWLSTLPLKGVRLGVYGISDVIVECMAASKDLEKSTFASHLVTIVKPPGPPLLANELRQTVPEGSIVPVICTSVGGNPSPTIMLSVGGQEITSEVIHKNGVTEARARVTARAADNGAAVLCEVSGPALNKAMTTVARLDVAFSPTRISGVTEPIEVDEGGEVTLLCETSSSHPVANITWRTKGVLLPESTQRISSGENGGQITGSQVTLKLKAEDNGRVYSCTADNGVTPPVTVNVTTRVRHGPVWVESPSELVEVHEGDDLLVTAQAAANPGPLRYRWEQYGRLVSEVGPELHISRISREEAGSYTVVASSPKGTINTSFTLDIMFAPEEVHAGKRVTVEEGGVANVECTARGNPKPRLYWSLQNSTYIEEKLSEGVGAARLVLRDVTKRHTGFYYCHAYNALGNAMPVATALVVTQAVEMASREMGQRGEGGWAAVGGIGLLACYARAAPRPTFVWTTEDGVTLSSPEKYVIHSTQLEDDLVLWSSRLEIRSVSLRDYGLYRCTAHNSLGAGTALIALHPPTPPPTPGNLTVVNVTMDSIVLAWTPGTPNRPAAYRNAARETLDDNQYTLQSAGSEQYDNNIRPVNTIPPDVEYIGQSSAPVDAAAASQAINSAVGYIVQYRSELTGKHQVVEVAPGSSPLARLSGLVPGVTYSFVVAASNEQGTSLPTPALAIKMPDGHLQGLGGWRTPRLLLLIMIVTGSALLALNLAIIVCFLRKRARSNSLSASSSKTTGIAVYPGTPVSEGDGHRELLTPTPLSSLSQSGNFSEVEQTNVLPPPALSPAQAGRSPTISGQLKAPFKPNGDITDIQLGGEAQSHLEAEKCDQIQSSDVFSSFPSNVNRDCLMAIEPKNNNENNPDVAPEVCSLAESCCDGRSPCRGDDQVPLSSWQSFPVPCPHYKVQQNIVPAIHSNSPQHQPRPDYSSHMLHRSVSSLHHHAHLHPGNFNRLSFIPHQPSSLPEQNTNLLDNNSTNSHVMHMHQKQHFQCHQNQPIAIEMQNLPHNNFDSNFGHDHHHHHHAPLRPPQHIHSTTSSVSFHCSPSRHTFGLQPNNFRMTHSPQPTLQLSAEGRQHGDIRGNYERSLREGSQARVGVGQHSSFTEKTHATFSALNPADLCGYTSDTQDSRCCQSGPYSHYGTLGSRPRHCTSPGQFSTLNRPHSRPQFAPRHESFHNRASSALPDLHSHGRAMSPDFPQQIPGGVNFQPRGLMRSFSVDDSTQRCRGDPHFHAPVDKPCSDYDNVSKYLLNPNSAENIDKSRLEDDDDTEERIHDHLKSISESLNLMNDECQPFPTHHNISHISKPNEPRVTFNEPIAETKTFHDPRLDDDDDDDFDEDSNVSSIGVNNNESNPIIYANNIVQNDLSSFRKQLPPSSSSQLQAPSRSPHQLKSTGQRSPPPPSMFRSSSSTSSNASSSSSSTVPGHRFHLPPGGQLSSDTSSNSSCSSAATISLTRNPSAKLRQDNLKGTTSENTALNVKLDIASELLTISENRATTFGQQIVSEEV